MLWDIAATYILPVLAVLIPPLYIIVKKRREDRIIKLKRDLIVKFFTFSLLFSFVLFLGLSYLSGGINQFYFLDQRGLIISDYGIEWNVTQQLRFALPIYNAINLLAISILSGFLYSGLLVLPKICIIGTSVEKVSSTSMSSITSSASALASSAVCCSTSLIAAIAPSFGLILGPYVPGLLIFSLVLMVYSFFRVVIPRIPLVPKIMGAPSLIS